MKTSSRLRLAAALALAAALLGSAPLLAQGAPVGGTIQLTLAPSTTAPAPSATFTVDLAVDLSAATGTCGGGTVVPLTLGAYNLGIRYDATRLAFVGASACPSAPDEFAAAPACANDASVPGAAFVNCNAVHPAAGTASNAPQGAVCVLRATFRNLTASAGAPAALVTLHEGGARGIASQSIAGCGGPVTFPASGVLPAETVLFPAD